MTHSGSFNLIKALVVGVNHWSLRSLCLWERYRAGAATFNAPISYPMLPQIFRKVAAVLTCVGPKVEVPLIVKSLAIRADTADNPDSNR